MLTGDVSNVELPERSFDLVTIWSTIEHMADPYEAMARVAPVAAPGALVVITTGNVSGPLARRDLGEGDLMAPPEHLYFFAPRTITRLLTGAGFNCGRIVQGRGCCRKRPLASGWFR